jgi:hypothetical protein
MVKNNNPGILFLIETMCNKFKLKFLHVKLGFAGLFVVDYVGRIGGLALMWKEEAALEIQNYSRQHINAIVKNVDSRLYWKLTGFYGHPNWAKRHKF